MKKNIKSLICGTVAALACAISANAASTGATIYLWDGTAADNKTVTDGGIGDGQASDGAVTFSGAVGSFWTINVDTGISKPNIGSAAKPSMDLAFVDTALAGAPTLGIAFFDNGFTGTLAGAFAQIGGTLASGFTLTYSTYTRAGNSAATFTGGALDLSTWTLLTTQTFGPGGSFSGDATAASISGGADPYSLLEVITLTSTTRTGGNSSGNATLQAPDGGMTAMLLGSSLTALALLRRSFKLGKV